MSHRGVHMVGSVPLGSLNSTREVFDKLCTLLPGRLRRIPDGELGDRWYYVNWQTRAFSPELLRREPFVPNTNIESEGKKPSSLPVDPLYEPTLDDVSSLGYDAAAIASYQEFKASRAAGTVPPGVRFQVSLPMPLEPVGIHVEPVLQAKVAPLYEQRMIENIRSIQAAIPAEDLALQLDIAMSIGFIEAERGNLNHPAFAPWFTDVRKQVLDCAKRLLTAMSSVEGIEVGVHLCYGDIQHQHFMEPADVGLMVEMANELNASLESQRENESDSDNEGTSQQATGVAGLAWVHMPVPKSRTDEAYFEPLQRLSLKPETQLFLGLVHPGDMEGARERAAAADKFAPHGFGVATECGMGRTPPDQMNGILEIGRIIGKPY